MFVRVPDCRLCELDEKVTHYSVVLGAPGKPSGVTRAYLTFGEMIRDPRLPWSRDSGPASTIHAVAPLCCGVFQSRRQAEEHYRMGLGLEASAVVPHFD